MSNYNKLLTAGIGIFVVFRIGFGIGSTILSYSFAGWLSFRAHKSSLVRDTTLYMS